MKTKLIILIFSFFLLSCSSLKKNKQESKTETNKVKNTEQNTTEIIKVDQKKTEAIDSKSEVEEDEFEVEIKPGDSLIIEKFDSKGKSLGGLKYKGSGTLKKKNKKTTTAESKIVQEQNKIDSELNIKFNEEKKVATKAKEKNKEVDRYGIPIIIYFLGFLILIIAVIIYKYRTKWIQFFKSN